MRRFLGLAWVLVPALCWGQPDTLWTRFYGDPGANESAYDLCLTADGGAAIAGYTYAGGVDMWMIRVDQNGDSLWSRRYGGSGNQYAYGIDCNRDGGFVLCGYTEPYNTGPRNCYVVRTNAVGDTLWTREYGQDGENGDGAMSTHEAVDGGYFIGGKSQVSGYWLIRTDAQGDTLWTRAFGPPDPWGCSEVRQTSDSGFIMAGGPFRAIRLDANGDSVWCHDYAYSSFDHCTAVRQTRDGGFVLAGSLGLMQHAFAIMRIKAAGDTLWTRTYQMGLYDICSNVCETADDGFMLAGNTAISDTSYDYAAVLLKVNGQGDSLWSLSYGSTGDHGFVSVCQMEDRGYFAAGYGSAVAFGDEDMFLLKTAPDPERAQDHSSYRPSSISLSNFPNPFNSTTEIAFDLPKAGKVSLKVFDLLGREVAVVQEGMMAAGSHRVNFDGKDLASGVYVYRLQAGDAVQAKKMVSLK